MRVPKKPKPVKVHLSRRFRHNPTEAEKKAWNLLRNRQILGLKFRRQRVIDGFIVDFYCAEERLILEIDGAVHDDAIARDYDQVRSSHFASKGLNVLRIRNEDVTVSHLVGMIESHLS
jgi:very-short-patch-repair endonuclease